MPLGNILVVEDDPAIRRGLVDALSFSGYSVQEAADGGQGLRTALAAEIDLLLLDVMLPERDGFSVLEEVRDAKPGLPVIMLTARGTEEDRIRGLRGGADDYVVKPFSAKELLARVEAVLRRSPERPKTLGTVELNGRTLDFERREVRFKDGGRTEFSEKESELLHYLAANPGRAISRDELLSRVWGLDPRGIQTRTVDMHVVRLRERLRDDPQNPKVIVTVRAKGYMLAQGEPD
ncbi:MAG: DNA-binding response regulator [Planctomycetes bacterium]|nr:DNA-binding response regulator [Planctomycetota bacterium]